jgi:hypothetical protein
MSSPRPIWRVPLSLCEMLTLDQKPPANGVWNIVKSGIKNMLRSPFCGTFETLKFYVEEEEENIRRQF